jgi:hypothetical protein
VGADLRPDSRRVNIHPRLFYTYFFCVRAKKKHLLPWPCMLDVGCGSTADKRKKVDCSVECTSKLIYMRDMNVHVMYLVDQEVPG